jgi:hypothetical protein
MPPIKPTWNKIDQQLTSAPYTHGAQTVQMVARLTGWRLTLGNGTGGFTGAFVHLQPTTLLVRQAGGESTLPLADPVHFAQLSLLKIALVLSGICALLIFVAGRVSPKD